MPWTSEQLYAVGATLYEMATGRPPFEQADALQLIHDHLVREPVAPWQVDARVPRGLSNIIMRLLAKAPEQRYKGPAVNHNATNPRVPPVVRPEIPTMLEAGLKNLFLDGRFAVNVSAYAMKIKDYQATVWDPASWLSSFPMRQNSGTGAQPSSSMASPPMR